MTEKWAQLIERRTASGYYAEMGRRGGAKNRDRQLASDPYYFETIGTRGGNKILAERGHAYYSQIGKLGSAARLAKTQVPPAERIAGGGE